MFDGPADKAATRFVLDESSLDFAGLSTEELTDALEVLLDVIAEIARKDGPVRIFPLVYDVECLPGVTLSDFLFSSAVPSVTRDLTRRFFKQLDKCPSWESDLVGGNVRVAGQPLPMAFSVEYAARSTIAGHLVGCVVLPRCQRQGSVEVWIDIGRAEVYFLGGTTQLPLFWRNLFAAESVPESEFFDLASRAFPGLLMHPNLTFGRFEGTYNSLRDQVAVVLGVLDDRFRAALDAGAGIPDRVQAELGQYGVDVSPESSNTRGSASLMKLRTVEYAGVRFRCEWHAKLERHRNRIHFTLPAAVLDGRILVGIFVDHLDTGR